MKTHRFEPAIGQRYLHRQLGVADRIWVITAISQPRSVGENSQLTFTEEVTERVFRHTAPYLAQQTLTGTLRPQRPKELECDVSPLALADLVVRMSHGQRQRFKMRVSYVQALERAGIGLSPKSHDFAHVVGANHSSRLASWTTRLAKGPGQLDDWVEPSAPAPSSVYRWYLQYRKAGNDLRVLAQEALATHTRTARKPKEREVLEAFLANRLAAIGTQSVSDLTNDFNRLMARTDPLHIDDLIENLYLEAQVKADQNRAARRGKSSMKKKFKATTASHGFENSFGRQGESIATAHET